MVSSLEQKRQETSPIQFLRVILSLVAMALCQLVVARCSDTGACGHGPLLGSVGASGFAPAIAGSADEALQGRRNDVLKVRANQRTDTRTFLPRFRPPGGVKPYVLLV